MADEENEIVLQPGQVCIAIDSYEATQAGDLGFSINERITIVSPSGEMYWYIGRNSSGKIGTVPSNYLKPIEDEPPALPPKPKQAAPGEIRDYEIGGYEKMGPGGAASAPIIPVKAKKSMTEEEREMIRIYERERHKRYATGTLVVATANFCAEKVQDMSFRVHEEMTLMKPMADLCWYYAQKVENPSVKGVIPITHVRLVYMSDDEDEDQIYNKPKAAGHDKLYDDRNDFISNSGWFQFPGLPLGKEAQLNVLAKKAGLSYDSFISTKRAVYVLSYRQEKVFVGKADNLAEELMKHFESFGQKRHLIKEIDDELCHHTDSSGWNVMVYPLTDDQNLELEWSKKVVEHDSLIAPNGAGINENLTFTDRDTFDQFWEWLSPN